MLNPPKLLDGVCSEMQTEPRRIVESTGEGSVSSVNRLRFIKNYFFPELGYDVRSLGVGEGGSGNINFVS